MSKFSELMEQKRQRDYEMSLPKPVVEPPGFIEDVAQGVFDWFSDAKTNISNLTESSTAMWNIAGQEVNSDLMQSYMNGGLDDLNTDDIPIMNPEQERAYKWHQKAEHDFLYGTVRPAASLVASLGAASAIGIGAAGALGVKALGGAKLAATVASLAYTPFMVSDLKQSIEHTGYGETTKEVALGQIPLYAGIQLQNDPEFQKFCVEHPGQGYTKLALTYLESLNLLAHPTGVAVGKTIKGAKKGTTYAFDKIKDPMVHLKAQEIIEKQKAFFTEKKYLDMARDVTKKVKEGKLRLKPKSKNESLVDDLTKATQIEKNATTETKYFTNGGRDIPIGESNLTSPIKANTIYETLNKIAKVRTGHLKAGIKKNVLGYFEKRSEGIRVRDNFDFGVASHEIGHFIDKHMGIQGHDQELITLFKKTWGEKSSYKPDEYRSEGIAEFTREYLLNPAEAQKSCPEFYNAFTEELAKNPELAKNMDVLGNQIRQWFNQGEVAQLGGAIIYESDTPKVNWKEWLQTKYIKRKADLIDQWTILKEFTEEVETQLGRKLALSQNPYQIALSMRKLASAHIEILLSKKASPEYLKAFQKVHGAKVLKHQVFLADVFGEIPFKEFNTKHAEWLKSVNAKDAYEGFGNYLVAKSGLARAAEMGRRQLEILPEQLKEIEAKINLMVKNPLLLMEVAELAEVADNIRQKIDIIQATGYDPDYKLPFTIKAAEHIRDTAPLELRRASTKLREFNENMLDLSEHYGLITAKEKAYLLDTYEDYVPFQRIFEADSQGLSLKDKLANDNLTDIKPFIKAMSEEGSTRMIKDPLYEYSKVVQSIITKGEKNKVGLSLVNLYKKIEGMGDLFMEVHHKTPVGTKEMTFAVWDKGKRKVYQATDPLLYNVLKNTEAELLPFEMQIAQAVSNIFREGTTLTWGFGLMNACRDTMSAFVNSKSKKLIPLVPIVDTVIGAFKRNDKQLYADFEVMGIPFATRKGDAASYRKFATKTMVRAGTPDDIMSWSNRMLETIIDKGFKFNNVLEEAPRLTEFERILKETGDIHKAGKAAAEITSDFSNGGKVVRRINRYDTFLNAAVQGTRNFWNNTLGAKENRGIKIARSSMIIGAGLALWSLNHNDERYRKLSADLKNRYYCFFVPGVENVVVLPKDQGVGAVVSCMERLLDYYVDNNLEAPDSLKPFLEGNFVPSIIPRIAYPIFELYTNQNFFTGQDIVPKHMQDVSPRYQYDNNTSYFARAVGDMTNTSPKKVDHLVGGLTGTLGKEALKAADYVVTLGDTNRPEIGAEQLPLTSRFFRDPSVSSEPVRILYKKLQEAKTEAADEQHLTGAKKAKKDRELKGLEKAQKELSKIWKEQKRVSSDRKYSPQEKRIKVKELRNKATKVASDALKKYTDYQY